MVEVKYEIVEHIGTLSESPKGWTKELNKVSWNGADSLNMILEIGHRNKRRWEKE